MISISYSDVQRAWRDYTDALRRGGANSADARDAKDRYHRLADLHENLSVAFYEAEGQ